MNCFSSLACIICLAFMFTGPGCDEPKGDDPVVTPAPKPEPEVKPYIPGAVLTDELSKLHLQHTKERAARDTMPLVNDSRLNIAAYKHAKWMADKNIMSHVGVNGSHSWTRISQSGFKSTWSGENIAAGQMSSDSVFRAWMNSPGHRANIYNRGYTHIGLGVARRGNKPFWCVVFAKKQVGTEEVDMTKMSMPGPIESTEYDDDTITPEEP